MTSHPFVARHFSNKLLNYAVPHSLNSSAQLLRTVLMRSDLSEAEPYTYTDVQVWQMPFELLFRTLQLHDQTISDVSFGPAYAHCY